MSTFRRNNKNSIDINSYRNVLPDPYCMCIYLRNLPYHPLSNQLTLSPSPILTIPPPIHPYPTFLFTLLISLCQIMEDESNDVFQSSDEEICEESENYIATLEEICHSDIEITDGEKRKLLLVNTRQVIYVNKK